MCVNSLLCDFYSKHSVILPEVFTLQIPDSNPGTAALAVSLETNSQPCLSYVE